MLKVTFLSLMASAIVGLCNGELILNGNEARPGQFPYQVYLAIQRGPTQLSCGGTLISDKWILTAAHCITESTAVTAILGAVNIMNPSEIGRQEFSIARKDVIAHKGFRYELIQNDIALLKLPKSVKFNGYIQPARLPYGESVATNYQNVEVITSGWGLLADRQIFWGQNVRSPILNYISSTVTKARACEQLFNPVFYKNTQICVGSYNLRSTCSGDSGGPLVLSRDRRTVIGVTSYVSTSGCGNGFPFVFTKVAAYLDWIKKHTKL